MIEVRRVLTHVEDIHHEFGPVAATPLRRGAIAVVLTNPYAGRYEPDILPMMDALQALGVDMAARLRVSMGVPVVRMHWLRHTLATILHRAGVEAADAAMVLGHSTQVHLTHYVTPTQRGVDRAAAAFAATPLLRGDCCTDR